GEAVVIAGRVAVVLEPQVQRNGEIVADLPVVSDVAAKDIELDSLFGGRGKTLEQRRACAAAIEEIGQVRHERSVDGSAQRAEVEVGDGVMHPREAEPHRVSSQNLREIVRDLILKHAPSLGEEE